jgi:peptide-methionine (S)-S-oxide reductase
MENQQSATFGAGCFWHVQAAFDKLDGVLETSVGFMGGTVKNPSYEDVSAGETGHTEVTRVMYDPSVISYEQLLDAFWEMHDPTQVDRQGPDVGRQYRSVIYYYTPEQKEAAEHSKSEQRSSGKYAAPIATHIEPASDFYRAEEYHQKYFQKTGKKVC